VESASLTLLFCVTAARAQVRRLPDSDGARHTHYREAGAWDAEIKYGLVRPQQGGVDVIPEMCLWIGRVSDRIWSTIEAVIDAGGPTGAKHMTSKCRAGSTAASNPGM